MQNSMYFKQYNTYPDNLQVSQLKYKLAILTSQLRDAKDTGEDLFEELCKDEIYGLLRETMRKFTVNEDDKEYLDVLKSIDSPELFDKASTLIDNKISSNQPREALGILTNSPPRAADEKHEQQGKSVDTAPIARNNYKCRRKLTF